MLRKLGGLCTVGVLILTGCGSSYSGSSNGGGGGGGGTSYAGQAQGVYSGTSSNGYAFESIVLPNDKFYALYGTVSSTSFFVDGMITGQGTSGNGTHTATVTDFFNTGTVTSGSISATDMPGSSVNGTVTENANAVTFNGTALASSSFNYNNAASVSAISGIWTGTLLDGMSTTVTINSNGSFSGTSAGCSFSGTVTADSSNKNFFDISLTFGASPCAFPNQTATGIAVYYLLSDGVTHQLVAAVAVGTSEGTVFFAQR
jgi:hypothetical protein